MLLALLSDSRCGSKILSDAKLDTRLLRASIDQARANSCTCHITSHTSIRGMRARVAHFADVTEWYTSHARWCSPIGQVRGNRRVTSRTAEDVYEALGKYSRDLTAEAREGKLDPVIGRDDEVRNGRNGV